jgi:hypothetical protein
MTSHLYYIGNAVKPDHSPFFDKQIMSAKPKLVAIFTKLGVKATPHKTRLMALY